METIPLQPAEKLAERLLYIQVPRNWLTQSEFTVNARIGSYQFHLEIESREPSHYSDLNVKAGLNFRVVAPISWFLATGFARRAISRIDARDSSATNSMSAARQIRGTMPCAFLPGGEGA